MKDVKALAKLNASDCHQTLCRISSESKLDGYPNGVSVLLAETAMVVAKGRDVQPITAGDLLVVGDVTILTFDCENDWEALVISLDGGTIYSEFGADWVPPFKPIRKDSRLAARLRGCACSLSVMARMHRRRGSPPDGDPHGDVADFLTAFTLTLLADLKELST